MSDRARHPEDGGRRRAGGADGQDALSVERIVEVLRRDIQTGALSGGESVHERQLAARFGVSRTPVREATARLVAEGLLIKAGGRNGLTVFRPSAADLREIYEIRLSLECLAARLAAMRRSDAGLPGLDERLADLRSMTGGAWLQAHRRFHIAVYEHAGRPRLTALIEQFRSTSEPYIGFYVGLRPRGPIDAEHTEIVRAVQDGDPDRAEDATRHHLQNTLRKLEDWLPSRGEPRER